MRHHVIRITAFDKPMPSVRRQIGATNIGFYCRCGEFNAFAVSSRREPEFEFAFSAEQLVPVLCPFCGNEDRQRAEDFVQLVLTETNIRQHVRH